MERPVPCEFQQLHHEGDVSARREIAKLAMLQTRVPKADVVQVTQCGPETPREKAQPKGVGSNVTDDVACRLTGELAAADE